MRKGTINGTAWHTEKIKGSNETQRRCFNCYYFDENACNIKMIPITTNNARLCSRYRFRETEKFQEQELKTEQTILQREMHEKIKKVQYGDMVELYDYVLRQKFLMYISNKAEEIERNFIKLLLNKKESEQIFYDGVKYQIFEIRYSEKIPFEANPILRKHHEEFLDKKSRNKKGHPERIKPPKTIEAYIKENGDISNNRLNMDMLSNMRKQKKKRKSTKNNKKKSQKRT